MNLTDLINHSFLNSLDEFNLVSKTLIKNIYEGLNLSYRSGFSEEFNQYRSYQDGDDPKFIDWSLYARSDRYFVKLGESKSRSKVRIVIDASRSMDFKTNSLRKIDYSKFIAASISQIAKNQHDDIILNIIADQEIHTKQFSSDKSIHQLLHELININCSGKFIGSTEDFYQYINIEKERELIIFISDFYQEKTEVYELLTYLLTSRNEINVFHIISEEEKRLSPKHIIVKDLESGEEIHSSQNTDYLRGIERYLEEVKLFCKSNGMDYELIQNSADIINSLRSFLSSRVIR
jgi:uncharacterized protein (DUF58 family)